MARIRIMFSRFSAFYSPLIAAAGRGLPQGRGARTPSSRWPCPERPAQAGLRDGHVDLIQSAVSASFRAARARRDARTSSTSPRSISGTASSSPPAPPDPAFAWAKLAGASVLVDHGMPAARHVQVCPAPTRRRLRRLERGRRRQPRGDAGGVPVRRAITCICRARRRSSWRRHGVGHVVAAVGEAIGPVAFSSLCARLGLHRDRTWRARSPPPTRGRALGCARPPAARVAEAEAGYFKATLDPEVLTHTIAAYQHLGCWDGALAIPRERLRGGPGRVRAQRALTSRRPCLPPPW